MEKEELWAKRVKDCRESNLTVVKWYNENDIKVPTFYTWQQKTLSKSEK